MHTSIRILTPPLPPMSVTKANRTHFIGTSFVAKCGCKCRWWRKRFPDSTLATGRCIHPLPDPQSLVSMSLRAAHWAVPSWLTYIAAFLSILEPDREKALKAIPRLCQCRSALPAASRNPLHELITHCEKAIYPQIPKLKAFQVGGLEFFEPCCF